MRRVACGIALLFCWTGVATAGQHTLQGRRLDVALRLLQQAGLQIVFSSEMVTPGMRVVSEPHAGTPRQQLDELLEPHGLKAEQGPGGVILVVRNPAATATEGAPKSNPSAGPPSGRHAGRASSSPKPAGYTDNVIVKAARGDRVDIGVSGTTIDGSALHASRSVLQSDALAAVHTMPRVDAVDDLRGDFSVRGSPYRQISVVIDGVATPLLQHTVYGRRDAGSLSMFGSDILDRATLVAGAYPRRSDDTLGAQLELTLKEGSRESTHIAATLSGMSAGFAGEGPLGNDGRGSWMVGLRNSYRSWPPGRLSPTDVGFAFADVNGKVVYDVAPTQQISVTVLGGRSTLDTVDEPLTSPLGSGTDRAALFAIGWQSTFGSHTVVRQRVFLVGQELVSRVQDGQLGGRSSNGSLGYRGEVLHSFFGGLFEAGVEGSRNSGQRTLALVDPAALRGVFGAAWATHAAYANFARALPRGLSFEVGARASDSTLVRRGAMSPWILGAWRFLPDWTLNASAGASRQFPDLDAVLGIAGSSDLVPERATHVDVSIERRLASGTLVQAALFNRVESDVLRGPDMDARRFQSLLRDPSTPDRYRNALHGISRGIELVVAPMHIGRVSGSMSYTYATARQNDVGTQETFWNDVDRRHAFNGAGVVRIGRQSTAGIILRAASGVPLPGYFDVTNGRLVLGDRRNEIRLPPYVRLDLRAQRTLFSSRHAVTLFGEVLNVLNRQNQGIAEGIVQPLTGEATGFTRPLLSRRASIGIQVALAR